MITASENDMTTASSSKEPRTKRVRQNFREIGVAEIWPTESMRNRLTGRIQILRSGAGFANIRILDAFRLE
jgi:hypothetical protein